MIHTIKGFHVVSEAEVDVFLEFPCFLYDPMSVSYLISGSSAFCKSSFYIWKLSIHVLWKPTLKDFEYNLTSMRNTHNCTVVWTFFGIPLLWDWNENWPFLVLFHCWVFQICAYIECSTLTASPFRIWNSSVIIPSPPLALFAVMLPLDFTHQDVWL